MEARGKQHLWLGQKPEVLGVLRKQAIVQSAESSNRIEGVTVAANRLRPLVIGRARPRDRSEEELAGYRAALDWIFSRKSRIAVTPDAIRRLHALAQGGSSGDAGEWKKRDNEIVEILPSGERSLRFVPVSSKKTPAARRALRITSRTAGASRSRNAWPGTRTRKPPVFTTGATMTSAWAKSSGSGFEAALFILLVNSAEKRSKNR